MVDLGNDEEARKGFEGRIGSMGKVKALFGCSSIGDIGHVVFKKQKLVLSYVFLYSFV